MSPSGARAELRRLVEALRADDDDDPRAGLLALVDAAWEGLGAEPRAAGWERLGRVATALALPAPDRPAAQAAAGGTLQARAAALVEPLARLGLEEGVELLAQLAAAPAPADGDSPRLALALLRSLDELSGEARYLEAGPRAEALLAPLRALALAQAREGGARVGPDPTAPEAVPTLTLPAFGPPGAAPWVERHGYLLPDGRREPARLRRPSRPAPPWFEPLLAGYRALHRARAEAPELRSLLPGYRTWLDELPALTEPGRQATTLRYAASALFPLAERDPAARAAWRGLVLALEGLGSFLIPLRAGELGDEGRYELLLERGAGAGRLVRPGFQDAGGRVQQRARVAVDPDRLGSA